MYERGGERAAGLHLRGRGVRGPPLSPRPSRSRLWARVLSLHHGYTTSSLPFGLRSKYFFYILSIGEYLGVPLLKKTTSRIDFNNFYSMFS